MSLKARPRSSLESSFKFKDGLIHLKAILFLCQWDSFLAHMERGLLEASGELGSSQRPTKSRFQSGL